MRAITKHGRNYVNSAAFVAALDQHIVEAQKFGFDLMVAAQTFSAIALTSQPCSCGQLCRDCAGKFAQGEVANFVKANCAEIEAAIYSALSRAGYTVQV